MTPEPGHSCADRQGVWAIGGTHGASTVTLVSNRGAIHVTTLPWRAQRLWALEAGVLIEAERSTPRVAGETGLLYLSHPLDPPRPLRIESGDWDGTVLLTSRTAPPLLLSHSPRLGAHVAWALATEGGEGEDGAVLLRCVWSEPAPAPASDAFLFAASSACVLLCLVLPERGGGGAALAQVHRVALPAGHAGAPPLPSRPCGAVAAVAARPVACPADTPPRLETLGGDGAVTTWAVVGGELRRALLLRLATRLGEGHFCRLYRRNMRGGDDIVATVETALPRG
ncbi:hypothetical protein EMIHUDRAFT_459274 [Emiliania huxleyi CCMP1516]|uniref:Protein kinase domain-containing protein n=2 Tax=Emiliania huxleyi TaxID=2903 RepID=A0A0D3IWY0_EMIH1|nr:hypothetical protein EMIHUDRAFT_459274 [Emiliania huxleyi CCMP1516]EOD15765.1 hypothetical protein EMIHUDRAFT_459274 [Emiliania huxleyi CCMP1516]|eukprot:XP_005768194.1 hypothetical protein EMIHUDRAFT_459274 [Emiliania huxleyi CCMP1516]